MYIANRVFGGLPKLSAMYKHRQIVDLAFKMKKIKTTFLNAQVNFRKS